MRACACAHTQHAHAPARNRAHTRTHNQLQNFDSDLGMTFITENGLQAKTFGVFTKCDKLDEDDADVLKAHIKSQEVMDKSDITSVQVSLL